MSRRRWRPEEAPEPVEVVIPIPPELETYLLSASIGFNPPTIGGIPGSDITPAYARFTRRDCGITVDVTERGDIRLFNFPKNGGGRLSGWWRVEFATRRMPIPASVIVAMIRQAVLEYAEPVMVRPLTLVEAEETAAAFRRGVVQPQGE